MKTQIFDSGVKLWLSAFDTDEWAHRDGASWPCSQLAGNRLFVEFDRNGLCDLAINGRMKDCDANELNAITSDFLASKLPKEHPCYSVVVGQFQGKD